MSVTESIALFMSEDLQAVLRRHRKGVPEMVNRILASQFSVIDTQKLTEKVFWGTILMPIKLNERMIMGHPGVYFSYGSIRNR